MGRRADRLKADDPFSFSLPSALADFRACVGERVEMDTTLHASPPRRDKREDHATWRQGVPHAHTQTKQLTHASPISPAIASQGDSCAELCCAALCALLCCAVMWLLHPLSASPVFQRGGPPWPPILFLTSHSIFSLLRQALFPCLLACPSACLSACLPGCVLLAPIERESASLFLWLCSR